MAYTQADFEVFSIRPKKAIRNAEGVRVVEDFTDEEWEQSKANCQALIDGYDVALFEAIRQYRNKLLNDSDWAMHSDSPLSNADKTSLTTWRTTLRNLPASETDPDDITIPDCPVTSLGITVIQPSI
tara:strand:- start:761 stop:1141 length:381 start_codon:yes stop_codon:yes gene_type:complete